MTPFGARVRELRHKRQVTMSQMAAQLGVSAAYLSALEHGKRGRPSFTLVQGVIHVLGVIWDEADELVRLADMSDPRVTLDTAGLEPAATYLANRLAGAIGALDDVALARLIAVLDENEAAKPLGRPPQG